MIVSSLSLAHVTYRLVGRGAETPLHPRPVPTVQVSLGVPVSLLPVKRAGNGDRQQVVGGILVCRLLLLLLETALGGGVVCSESSLD